MILTLTITPEAVYFGKNIISERDVPLLAQFCTVVDKRHPNKLIVNFEAELETPGVWRLPWCVLKLLY